MGFVKILFPGSIEALIHPSEEQVLVQNGGRKRVLENPDLTMQVAAQIEGRDHKDDITGLPGGKPTDKAKQESGKAQDLNKPAAIAGGKIAFNRAELLELRQPLEKILRDSLPYYENKLLAQVEVIKNQINKSTQQILNRLEAGSHQKIIHPDVRVVWKDMVWISILLACFGLPMRICLGLEIVCQGQAFRYGSARLLPRPLRHSNH